MTLIQAEYLEAVCRTGSISAAAAELYVSRTVISHSLRELEEEFNANFFTRTRNGVKLTPAGEILRDYCHQIRASYAITRGRIDALNLEKTQQYVKLGISVTTGGRLFPDCFKSFRTAFPDIGFTVIEMSAYDSIESVRTGVVDFAVTPVRFSGEDYRDIGWIFLHKVESVVCVSRDDPLSQEPSLTREQIAGRDFVTLNSAIPLPYPIKIIMRVNQINLIHTVVANGIALTLLPEDYTKDWDDVVTIPFRDPIISDVRLVWSKSLPHSNAFYRFLNFISNYDISKFENR